MLGICRGAQLINVAHGGDLFADLRPMRVQTGNRRLILPRKTLNIRRGSRLAKLIGQPQTRINSLHHQAVRRVGRGLQVSGRDLDGIVQAIEKPGRGFLIGTQWHPEYIPQRGTQRRLFKELVREAARRALSAPRSHRTPGDVFALVSLLVRGRWRTSANPAAPCS